MGDHSKTAIHTAFNTASVVGAMCNVFGNVTPPKHLPSFSWGFDGEVQELERAFATAQKVMARRNQMLTPEAEQDIRDAFAARESRL
jgi:hypothetical protein